MRNKSHWLMMVVAIAACGGSDEKPPSCQDAIDHYYSAGCVYYDPTTSPPTPIAEGDFIGRCQNAAASAPAACQDEINAFLSCNAGVPSPARSNADCDCSAEFMAVLQCR